MRFDNLTQWDPKTETIDEWLARERKAKELVENPSCPHCHYSHEEWWEFSGLSDYEVEGYEMQCHSCNNKFLCDKETRVRFETRPLDSAQESK